MQVTCEKHGKRMFLVRCEELGVEEHTYINQHLVFTVKLERIKNAIRRLLADERHETVQPLVLLSPWLEHFNLDTKSESLPAPKSDEPLQMGIQAVEARHHLYTTNLENTQPGWSRRSAGDAQATRRRRAHGTHIKSVAEFSESWVLR
jgi:hypothetical protein